MLSTQLSFGGQYAAWPVVVPIEFPLNDQAEFVRITLEPSADAVPGLRVVDETGTEVPYVVDPDLHRADNGAPRSTGSVVERSLAPSGTPSPSSASARVWVFDIGYSAPNEGVRFHDGSAAGRTVDVEAGADGKLWHPVSSGALGRAGFAFPEEEDRYWRVTLNGPAAAGPPVLLERTHDLLFEATPGHRYALLTGNAAAPGTDYDLGARLERENWTATDGKLDAAVANEAFVENRPLFERYPWMGSAVLILAACLIAGLAYRVTRRPPPADPLRGPVA